MTKIVINRCWGGFGLSHKGVMKYAYNAGIKLVPYTTRPGDTAKLNVTSETYEYDIHYEYENGEYFSRYDIERDDPALVRTVEELGRDADGRHAALVVVEIPNDVKWYIDDHDGMEHVAENHRTWP